MILAIMLFVILFLVHVFNKRLWTLIVLIPIAFVTFLFTSGSWFSVFVVADIYLLLMIVSNGNSSSNGSFDSSWGSFGNGGFGGGFDGGGGDGGGGGGGD